MAITDERIKRWQELPEFARRERCRRLREDGARIAADCLEAVNEMTQTEQDPDWLIALRHNLATQDNRIAAHPVFVVQQRWRLYGVDLGHTDDYVWMDEDWEERELPEDEDDPPDNWQRVGYVDRWEFVTACFTEQGCKDYIAVNGHNLCEPRIYVESGHRNREWQRIREWLADGPHERLSQEDLEQLRRDAVVVREGHWDETIAEHEAALERAELAEARTGTARMVAVEFAAQLDAAKITRRYLNIVQEWSRELEKPS